MPLSAWVMLLLLAATFIVLFVTRIPPAAVFVGVLTICLTFHLAPEAGLLAGFSNASVLTVGTLFIVAAGMYSTGAVNRVVDQLIGAPRSLGQALSRMLPFVGVSSAFLNNTPLVAMMVPVVRDVSRATGLPPSKLYLPVSFASILGGAATLIGTSTNLIIAGMVASNWLWPCPVRPRCATSASSTRPLSACRLRSSGCCSSCWLALACSHRAAQKAVMAGRIAACTGSSWRSPPTVHSSARTSKSPASRRHLTSSLSAGNEQTDRTSSGPRAFCKPEIDWHSSPLLTASPVSGRRQVWCRVASCDSRRWIGRLPPSASTIRWSNPSLQKPILPRAASFATFPSRTVSRPIFSSSGYHAIALRPARSTRWRFDRETSWHSRWHPRFSSPSGVRSSSR
ncbi:MAG: hypothetical protein JO352_01360 [Chloroflexi bacterium]|nr:hypothetical protein [Chloroflexota bacterium]